MNKLILRLLVLVFIPLLLLSITTASALEKQVNITVVTVLPSNASLETIKVDGITYGCENNKCTIYVPYDCPTCPAVNYADLQANISSRIATSEEKIIKSIIEHNSSPDFKRADIEALLADDDEAGKIQDFIQNTVMVKDSEYKNMTDERDYWEEKYKTTNENNSYLSRDLQNANAKISDNQFSLKIIWSLVIFLLFFLGLSIASREGITVGFRRRIKAGKWGRTPEERKLAELDEEIKNAEFEKTLHEKEQQLAEMGGEKRTQLPHDGAPLASGGSTSTVTRKRERRQKIKEYILKKGDKDYEHTDSELIDFLRKGKLGTNEGRLIQDIEAVRNEIANEMGGYFGFDESSGMLKFVPRNEEGE